MRTASHPAILACLALVGGVLAAPAAAQTRYWGPGDSLGGSGTWTSTSPTWGTSEAGPFEESSHGNSNNNYFAGPAGTVTVEGPVNFRSLNFLTDGYQLTGGNNPVLARNSDMVIAARDPGITTTITGITFDTPNDRHVFVGFGSDHENLGTVVFGGNYFDGQGMEVRSGTAVLEGTNTFKDLSNSRVVIREGGTLLIAWETAMGADPELLPDVPLLPGGQILFDETVLSGAFTFGSLSNSGALALENTAGAPIELTIGTNNRSTSHSGTLSGDGSLVKAGTGTFTLSGNNTYTGPTVIDEGTVRLGRNDTALGSAGDTYVNAGGTLDLRGYRLRDEQIFLAGTITNTSSSVDALRNITLSGDGATFTGTHEYDIRYGTLDLGDFTAIKDGTNNLRFVELDVASESGGGIIVDEGELHLFRSTWAQGTLTANSGATLHFRNNNPGEHSYSMDIVLNDAATLRARGRHTTIDSPMALTGSTTFRIDDNSLTATGVISGTGSLDKTDGGTLVLTGANTYEGGTTVSSGTLRVEGDGTLGTGDVTNEGSLAFNPSNELTVNNAISGSGSLTKLGSGTLVLAGENTYTGATSVDAGALRIAHSNALGDTSGRTTIAGGGASSRLELAGGVEFAPEPLTLGGRGSASSPAHVVNYEGENTWTGEISFTTGGHYYAIESASGTVTITGEVVNNTGNDAFRTLDLRGDGDGLISGQLRNGTGTGLYHVNKIGSGTWTLSGDNLHTGTTTVSAGTLLVNNTTGSSTGSGAVVVKKDAILGGTGIIGGPTAIEEGGILSPGVTIGRLTFEDALTLAPGSGIRWEFDGKEIAGEDYDSILGSGDDAALYLPNPQSDPIHLSIFGPGATLTPGDSFTLFDGTVFDHNEEPLAFGADLNGLFAVDDQSGWWGTWEVSAGSLILTAVPEPGTWLLLLSALACGLLVRRRR